MSRQAPSEARAAFGSLVRDHLAPCLRAQCFRKSAQTFWRRFDGTYGVLNRQKSAYNTADRVSFYVNVAVASDRLGSSASGPPPREAWMLDHLRLHHVALDTTSHDWSLYGFEDVLPIAAELEEAFLDCAVPFLGRFPNDDAILDYFDDILGLEGSVIHFPRLVKLARSAGREELALRAEATFRASFSRANRQAPELS